MNSLTPARRAASAATALALLAALMMGAAPASAEEAPIEPGIETLLESTEPELTEPEAPQVETPEAEVPQTEVTEPEASAFESFEFEVLALAAPATASFTYSDASCVAYAVVDNSGTIDGSDGVTFTYTVNGGPTYDVVEGTYTGASIIDGGTYVVTAHAPAGEVFDNGLETLTFEPHTFPDSNLIACPPPVAPTNTECAAFTPVTIDSALDLFYDVRTGTYELTSNGLALQWDHPTNLTQAKVAWYYATNFPLSQLGTPTIDYELTTGASVGQNFTIAVNGTPVGNIVAEPSIPNYWTTFSIPGMNPQPNATYRKAVGTIDDFLAAYWAYDPTLEITVIAVGGSGGSGSRGTGILHSQTAGCLELTFRAPAPPVTAPTILTPTSGTTTNTAELSASWTAVPLATYYETRVAKDQAMTSEVVGPFGPFQTSITTPVAEGTFWFQVRAVNADGAGPWSISSKFTTDTTNPSQVTETQVYETKEGGRIAVTLTFSEPIKAGSLGQGWNGSGTTWKKIFYTSKSHTVTFSDLAGNLGSHSFTVDATKPTVTNTQQAFESKQGGRVAVTLTFSEPINPASLPQGWYGSGTTFTKVFYTSKDVTVTFADLVGNPGTHTFAVDATAPTLPTNLSPNGWVVSANTLSWAASSDSSGPVTYEVAIGNHPNLVGGAGTAMSSGFLSLGTTLSTSLPHVLPIDATFWQVRAIDAIGNASAWTAPVGVQVIGVPVLSSTQTGTVTGDLTVSWTRINGIGGLDGYEVEYTLADGSTEVHLVSVLTDTQIASAQNQGAVSVRVRGIYAIGFTAQVPESKNGEWSNTLTFTRDSIAPAQVQQLLPVDGKLSTANVFDLTWTPIADADRYIFESTTVAPAASGDFTDLTGGGRLELTATSFSTAPGAPDNTYYWHVRAVDAAGNLGAWSTTRTVTVDTLAPAAVSLLTPDNGASITAGTAYSFSWTSPESGATFEIETSTAGADVTGADGRFAALGADGGALPLLGTSVAGAPAAALGTYYWHVRAIDAAGNAGPWSEVRSLTRVAAPVVPTDDGDPTPPEGGTPAPTGGTPAPAAGPGTTTPVVPLFTVTAAELAPAQTADDTEPTEDEDVQLPTEALPGDSEVDPELTSQELIWWPWLVALLGVLGAVGFILFRRRNLGQS